MGKDDRDDNPRVGEKDPAPLFLVGSGSKSLTEAEHQERFGPPYGPCGVACDCTECQAHREKLRTEGPDPVVSPEEYKFIKAIDNILKNEPRAEWRELIKSSSCFAKMWRDSDDDSICDELECDLRDLCQATWTSIKGGYTSAEDSLTTPARVRLLGKKRKRGRPPKKKKKKLAGCGRYERVPYVSTGRPVDEIARALYEFLGAPPRLPTTWYYGASKTQAQVNEARELFINEFGTGLFIIERSSYHHYMLNGDHFMRFWVNSAGGGWMDLSPMLTKAIMRTGRSDPAKTPASGRSTKFRFYPYRVFLSSKKSVKQFKIALTNVAGLEYLSERSTNED
jgi:hypothetical protein